MSGLTEATFAALASAVGYRREVLPSRRRADADGVRRFALALGDDNPRWWGAPPAAAPPTFLYTGVDFGMWPDLGGMSAYPEQPITVLWARDHWRWTRALKVDEGFAASSEILSVEPRDGPDGERRAQVTELITFTGEDGSPLAELTRRTVALARRAGREAPPIHRYAQKELEAIDAAYREETARRRGPAPRYLEDTRTGDTLGGLVKGPLSISSLISWATGWGGMLSVTNRMQADWLRAHPALAARNAATDAMEASEALHWDANVGKALGYGAGFDFGCQRISWVGHVVTDWMGDAGALRELDVRILRSNFIGDTIWFSGSVTDVGPQEGDHGDVTLEIRGQNQRGELSTIGRAVVRLPAASAASN